MVDIMNDIDWRSLIFGAAISAAIIIVASHGYDWLYLFSSIGLLYVGYNAKNLIYGAVLGGVATIPMAALAFRGAFGELTGFYTTTWGSLVLTIVFFIIGALVGVVGAWGKIKREQAKVEYEKQQKIGKNKNKNKNKNKKDSAENTEKKGFFSKIKK